MGKDIFLEKVENHQVMRSLYIKLEVGQTIKGDIEKIYLVCYPIFEKKETSCKEIVWSHATQNYSDRRFLMNQEDRTRLEEFRQFRKEVLNP
jgi:hypothetical protein